MRKTLLKSSIIFAGFSSILACDSTDRSTIKKKEEMFTTEQIKEKLSKVRTGADFPALAADLKKIGVTYYETKMKDGSSIYHGDHGYELLSGPNYEPIPIADKVDLKQLTVDIEKHQQGKSDYFQISRQSANNGIEKWAVCLTAMTCSYIDNKGNKVWVENIPDIPHQTHLFTAEQVKAAHSKVRSGADFPSYIREIKKLGVTHYETYVSDGHLSYHGANNYTVEVPEKYDRLTIADKTDSEQFKAQLLSHQQGKTDFITFIKKCATFGIEKWAIRMDSMTCTYYNKAGKEVLIEDIPVSTN